MIARSRFGFVVLVAVSLLLVSCGGSDDDLPRSFASIDKEAMSLDAIFLTDDGREIIAPMGRDGTRAEVIVDNGELAFAAYVCKNPNCKGVGKKISEEQERPYLFVWKDPLVEAKSDGTVGYREFASAQARMQLVEQAGGTLEPICPACLKVRNVDGESTEERQQYSDWCEFYVLPETEKRLKELDEERQQRIKFMKERKNRDVDLPKG